MQPAYAIDCGFITLREILREELDTLALSANALSKALDVPVNRITAILHRHRAVTEDTALRLARYFGTTPVAANSGRSFNEALARVLWRKHPAWRERVTAEQHC